MILPLGGVFVSVGASVAIVMLLAFPFYLMVTHAVKGRRRVEIPAFGNMLRFPRFQSVSIDNEPIEPEDNIDVEARYVRDVVATYMDVH